MMEQKRLERSTKDRKLCGVCGGIAEYLGLNSALVRMGWIVLFFAYGAGLLAYLVAAVVMPCPDKKTNNG